MPCLSLLKDGDVAFGIGRVAKDQVEDLARRKGKTVEWMERWLGSNLGY